MKIIIKGKKGWTWHPKVGSFPCPDSLSCPSSSSTAHPSKTTGTQGARAASWAQRRVWGLHGPCTALNNHPDQAPRPVCPPKHGQPVLYSRVSCESPISPTLVCDGVRVDTSSSSSPPWVQHFQEKSKSKASGGRCGPVSLAGQAGAPYSSALEIGRASCRERV